MADSPPRGYFIAHAYTVPTTKTLEKALLGVIGHFLSQLCTHKNVPRVCLITGTVHHVTIMA